MTAKQLNHAKVGVQISGENGETLTPQDRELVDINQLMEHLTGRMQPYNPERVTLKTDLSECTIVTHDKNVEAVLEQKLEGMSRPERILALKQKFGNKCMDQAISKKMANLEQLDKAREEVKDQEVDDDFEFKFPERLLALIHKVGGIAELHKWFVEEAYDKSLEANEKWKMYGLSSLILQEYEAKLLAFVDHYLQVTEKRALDVLIHDGGHIRRKEEDGKECPQDLIERINVRVKERFQSENLLIFINKPFDLSLLAEIDRETPYIC